jgi:NADP-dependent 3-hydroxy acid dehydrogenase YdfG
MHIFVSILAVSQLKDITLRLTKGHFSHGTKSMVYYRFLAWLWSSMGWEEAALRRGDLVVATARNIDTLTPLVETYGDTILPLELDVTDQEADHRAITRAYQTFGRLDVVINNAGYGLLGAIEEISVEKARDQMETNFFGALWITQAALPYLREQGSGHILQVSSIGGICAFPGVACTMPQSGHWKA